MQFNMGGMVPSSYYFSNTKPTIDGDMQSLTLLSGSKRKLKYNMSEPDSFLRYLQNDTARGVELTVHLRSLHRWRFLTEGGDIAFRIYRKRAEEKTDVLPKERVESHLIMEEGDLFCDQPGTCMYSTGPAA